MSELTQWYGTGRRKTSAARVWLRPGNGKVVVNKREIESYFGRATLRMVLKQPLELVDQREVDLVINVAVAVFQAKPARFVTVSRALVEMNGEYRQLLKKAGFLRRDSRKVERKKSARGARRRFGSASVKLPGTSSSKERCITLWVIRRFFRPRDILNRCPFVC